MVFFSLRNLHSSVSETSSLKLQIESWKKKSINFISYPYKKNSILSLSCLFNCNEYCGCKKELNTLFQGNFAEIIIFIIKA